MVPSPESVAAEVLAKYGVTAPPVPVHEIARKGGVAIHREHLEGSRSRAMVAVDQRGQAHIFINAAACDWRAQRFWVAHELGHLALWYRRILLDYRWREIWCSRFAAALLMPEAAVARLRVDARRVPLRDMFDVSESVVRIRLQHLQRQRMGA